MSSVRHFLTQDPPPILYHYTTQSGLLGIIESKSIWATHTQYLNDEQEFRHAIGIVADELARLRALPENRKLPGMFEEMEEGIKGLENMNVCVTSFSEEGDLLSQWRAYGGSVGGFAIGFSGAFLRSILGESFWLVKCLYEEAAQRELIRALLQDVLIENRNSPRKDGPPGGNLGAYLNRYAPMLKHRSFSEEREWRFMSRPLACTFELFGYRSGASMLVPYYRIPLETETTPFSIEEIIIGPTPHPEQSLSSLKGLLIRNKLKNTRIRTSDAPYRSW